MLPQANIIHMILQKQSSPLFILSSVRWTLKFSAKGTCLHGFKPTWWFKMFPSMNADNCSCLPIIAHTSQTSMLYFIIISIKLPLGTRPVLVQRREREEELTHTWALTTNCTTLAYCASVKATENLGPSPWGVPQWRGLNGGHSWWCIQFTHLNELTNLASMHSRETGRS